MIGEWERVQSLHGVHVLRRSWPTAPEPEWRVLSPSGTLHIVPDREAAIALFAHEARQALAAHRSKSLN